MRRHLAVALVCTGLFVPAAAQAQSADSGYSSTPGVSEASGPGGSAPTPARGGDTLAFTGRDTRTLSAAGVLLVGAGLLVRRRTRERS